MLYAFAILCLVGSVLAQIPEFGSCPNIEVDQTFDIIKYLGRWYEVESYLTITRLDAKCVTYDYSGGENGTIKIFNTQMSQLTGEYSFGEAVAYVPNIIVPAKLRIKHPYDPRGIEGDYWILGTDYDSFAVVFACFNFGQAMNDLLYIFLLPGVLQSIVFFRAQLAWILTRQRNPDSTVIAKADEVIAKYDIVRSNFVKTDQFNCEKRLNQ